MSYEIIQGNCIDSMRAMPDNSIDSIVTDPPYELGFMGKAWDGTGIAYSVEMWREAYRVLKPGGHLLAFSGSRTYHRMACAIEDAGFDIRDQIMWVYGSGFPKSLDVSKAIDKAAGAEREVIGNTGRNPNRMLKFKEQDGCKRSPTNEDITAPATDAARQWEGWGTALKPAHEPICVARKPLVGTVAANVLAHGTGALNIDACRVAADGNDDGVSRARKTGSADTVGNFGFHREGAAAHSAPGAAGRWPANLIHDGSEEVVALLPVAKGQQGATAARQQGAIYGAVSAGTAGIQPRDDTGSAARFFYCAKASRADRGAENSHPTVKPTDLMVYLVRLVTPPGGLVLDPFTGSGSTGKACMREGFRFVGCELSPEYAAIAQARIEHELTGGLL